MKVVLVFLLSTIQVWAIGTPFDQFAGDYKVVSHKCESIVNPKFTPMRSYTDVKIVLSPNPGEFYLELINEPVTQVKIIGVHGDPDASFIETDSNEARWEYDYRANDGKLKRYWQIRRLSESEYELSWYVEGYNAFEQYSFAYRCREDLLRQY